jgi:hypothetical protein
MSGLTPGVSLLLSQVQLVAHARGWDLPKTIKKLGDLIEILTKAQAKLSGTAAPVTKENSLIAMAEALLKEVQATEATPPAAPEPTPTPPPGTSLKDQLAAQFGKKKKAPAKTKGTGPTSKPARELKPPPPETSSP